ncbi:AraC family transcriptional regulator [Rhizobium sp. PL01]|uniref:helix-turn-helix domain-containing protein n=1 Tax=Rhizobium sp. PL01 TaxID=3085631 RepID=UPI002981FCC1|nr:AraC family transcriptional regulator [Rhizobium sp. PL01]MDW5314033.1 AraC family transcriptional regulator [Rhizobium sp. PL01]
MPLPFVVALLLLILLAVMLRGSEPSKGNRPFLALVGACALQSIVVGLRWGYEVEELRYVLPVLASCLPPLVWASFRSLIHQEGGAGISWLHAAPPLVIVALLAIAPALIDVALFGLFVGYALALLDLARNGTDALDEARLEGAVAAHRALFLAAASLCLSALFDLTILLDFAWGKGENAALIVGNANLFGLFLFGVTALVAARERAGPVPVSNVDHLASQAVQDRDILDRIDRLLTEQKLSRDENLTLSRLARRAGVPARQISGAVNRLAGKNVSQYINDFRIAEACRLLRETDMSVTSAMFECGFQTKSNFNREFRRVTSLSPASWREQNRMLDASLSGSA